jgi:hypothetical protein
MMPIWPCRLRRDRQSGEPGPPADNQHGVLQRLTFAADLFQHQLAFVALDFVRGEHDLYLCHSLWHCHLHLCHAREGGIQ